MKTKLEIKVPNYVREIQNNLIEYGYECYIVGGAIRDTLLGIPINDFDLATSASTDIIKRIFSDYYIINNNGLKHNTITIHINNDNIEITSFKHNLEEDNSIEVDLSHRDFTINSLAYSDHLVDPWNGYNDLCNHIIRANNPIERINEDPIRILRGLRLSSTLGFSINDETSRAIHLLKGKLKDSSKERIKNEIDDIISGANAKEVLLDYYDVIFEIIPELEATYNFDQRNPYHNKPIYDHLISTLDNIHLSDKYSNIITRTAGLLHDIGKPQCFSVDENGIGHFYSHSEFSREISSKILRRLRYSNKECEDILFLIKYHDYQINYTEGCIKKLLAKTPNQSEELIYMLLELINADRLDHTTYQLIDIAKVRDIIDSIKRKNLCINRASLMINGYDLIALGYSGREIREILDYLLDLVINDKINNDREELLNIASSYDK